MENQYTITSKPFIQSFHLATYASSSVFLTVSRVCLSSDCNLGQILRRGYKSHCSRKSFAVSVQKVNCNMTFLLLQCRFSGKKPQSSLKLLQWLSLLSCILVQLSRSMTLLEIIFFWSLLTSNWSLSVCHVNVALARLANDFYALALWSIMKWQFCSISFPL